MFNLAEQLKEIITEKVTGENYSVQTAVYANFDLENLTGSKLILVMPTRTEWVRFSRGKLRREYTVAVIIVTRGNDAAVDCGYFDQLLNEWAEDFMIDNDVEADVGGMLPDYSCMGVTTIDPENLGFIRNSVAQTPTSYIGGLAFRFWK